MLKQVGDSHTVRASKSLGSPEEVGKITRIDKVGSHLYYWVQFSDDPDNGCHSDEEGYVMCGPPLRGEYVRWM